MVKVNAELQFIISVFKYCIYMYTGDYFFALYAMGIFNFP